MVTIKNLLPTNFIWKTYLRVECRKYYPKNNRKSNFTFQKQIVDVPHWPRPKIGLVHGHGWSLEPSLWQRNQVNVDDLQAGTIITFKKIQYLRELPRLPRKNHCDRLLLDSADMLPGNHQGEKTRQQKGGSCKSYHYLHLIPSHFQLFFTSSNRFEDEYLIVSE